MDVTFTFAIAFIQMEWQGGYGTVKTGNLVVNFSRQGKHGEFKEFNKTQGKHREFGQGRETEYIYVILRFKFWFNRWWRPFTK